MKEFTYHAPQSLEEALSLTSRFGREAELLAGGTDLVVQMRHAGKMPSHVISLRNVPELATIEQEKNGDIWMGPLVTHASLATNRVISQHLSILSEAAATIGTLQIRNRGTIGGNICTGSPAGDIIPPLVCAGTRLRLSSQSGSRLLDIDEFFSGPQVTRRKPDEILTAIHIQKLPGFIGGTYLKLGTRRAAEISVVGVGALISLDESKTFCLLAGIGVASAGPIPLHCKKAEDVLYGEEISEEMIAEAARVAQKEASPITDLRSTSEYRSEMVFVLTKRAIRKALGRAKAAIRNQEQ